MHRKVYIHAAGGIGPNAMRLEAIDAAVPLAADAALVDLRQSGNSLGIVMPRLASRLAQLAVIGARLCANRLAGPLPRDTPVYLATGLGDVARTDALYYQVMPPTGEMASPAQFATSGNNMPAFFVAQQLGLVSRNTTLSQHDLSFELALQLALDDLAAGAATTALVGGVDETTLPREFYVRRYPLAAERWIGEGSAWLVLGTQQTGAIGEVAGVSMTQTSSADGPDGWAARSADAVQACIGTAGTATLMPGARIAPAQIVALRARLPQLKLVDYRGVAGCWPTAVALAVAGTFVQGPQSAERFVHINWDARGGTGIMAWRCYG